MIVYNQYNDYEQYMVTFSNPRMPRGWVRYKNEEVAAMNADAKSIEKAFREAIGRKDVYISPPST